MLSCLTEFNEEVFRKGMHEEGYIDGCEDTRKEDIIKAIKMSKSYHVTKKATTKQLILHYDLSPSEATELVNTHWD